MFLIEKINFPSPKQDYKIDITDEIKKAKKPIILLGDGVAWNGEIDCMVELAEIIGAKVYSADGLSLIHI